MKETTPLKKKANIYVSIQTVTHLKGIYISTKNKTQTPKKKMKTLFCLNISIHQISFCPSNFVSVLGKFQWCVSFFIIYFFVDK